VGHWFGSSGIRGPFPSDVHADLALRLGLATGSLAPHVLIGHDPRRSSPLLSQAFAAGVLSAGGRVDLAGGAATPSLAFSARRYDVAVAVTASHNPPADNGFKFWNPDGSAWLPEQEARLEFLLDAPSLPSRPRWDRLHAPGVAADVTERHIEAILRFTRPIRGRVVVDCGNGAGCHIAPRLLGRAGASVDVLFGDLDGTFPNRPSEPAPEHLTALRERCRKERAWGVAHDGDADRMVPVDPAGEAVPPERVLVALALHLKARRIATPVDASLALARALPEVQWDLTKVGDAHVSAATRTLGGQLGAETSGTYVVPAFDFAPDGPLASVLFLNAVEEGWVEEAARRLGPVHRRSEKVPLGRATREQVRLRLAGYHARERERATTVDGLRLDTPDGWFLVRPSGTEPVARVTAEGATPADAETLLERGRAVLHAALRGQDV